MEHYVFSFYLTYVLLLTTATITFIEAMRTKNATVQHIMNLETCISIIASYFYSVFNDKINHWHKKHQSINWKLLNFGTLIGRLLHHLCFLHCLLFYHTIQGQK